MTDFAYRSPGEIFRDHCRKGELAYQVRGDTGTAVFYPRMVAPRTAEPDLEWRISAGHGQVYSTTTVHPRNGEPYDVSLIDMDEGFRLMARVEGMAPADVAIGQRVRVRMHRDGEDGEPYPVFDPAVEA